MGGKNLPGNASETVITQYSVEASIIKMNQRESSKISQFRIRFSTPQKILFSTI
jgi:hypothetical protein